MRARTHKPISTPRKIYLPYSNLHKSDDGIVKVMIPDNLRLSGKEAQTIVEAINRLTCRIRRLVMIIAGNNTSFDEEFLTYVAFGDTLEYNALAFVVHGMTTAKDYVFDSAKPISFFANEKDATAWLKIQAKIPSPRPTDPDVVQAISGDGITITDELHHPSFDLYKRSDGIIVRASHDYSWFTIKEVKESAAAIKEITGGRPHFLLSVSGKKSSVDKEGRSYAVSAEGLQNIEAVAIITKNLSQKLIGNILMHMDKPPVPLRLFDRIDNAVAWLKSQNGGGDK